VTPAPEPAGGEPAAPGPAGHRAHEPADGDPVLAAVVAAVRDRCPAPAGAPAEPVHPDRELADLGFDSLRTVGLLVAVEEALALCLPAELITAQTFRTCRTLADACRAHLPSGPAPAARAGDRHV
jgi:acyl carrier protein